MAQLIQVDIPITVSIFVEARNKAEAGKVRKAAKRAIRRLANYKELVSLPAMTEPIPTVFDALLRAGARGWGPSGESGVMSVDVERAVVDPE